MSKSTINKQLLQNIHETYKADYLDTAEQCCLKFQEDIRKKGIKHFNVWVYLEQEFRKEYMKEGTHRKPPKAVTIAQWFNPDHVSGSKMGTEDLRLICQFINDPTPIIAYYNQVISQFDIKQKAIINLTKLNSLILQLTKRNGDLCDEYDKSLLDGKIDEDEAERLRLCAITVNEQTEEIIKALSDKKNLKAVI